MLSAAGISMMVNGSSCNSCGWGSKTILCGSLGWCVQRFRGALLLTDHLWCPDWRRGLSPSRGGLPQVVQGAMSQCRQGWLDTWCLLPIKPCVLSSSTMFGSKMRMWSSYCALIAQNVILNYVDNIHHSKRLMRELDHCREKCREANAISKGKKYITMRYGQKEFLSLR